MLVIRQEQKAALSAVMRDRFIQRMVERARSRFPEEAAGRTTEDLRDLVRAAIDRARTYGISLEGNLETFIDSTFEYGWDFDRSESDSWAAGVLRDPQLSETEKMNEISSYAVFADQRT